MSRFSFKIFNENLNKFDIDASADASTDPEKLHQLHSKHFGNNEDHSDTIIKNISKNPNTSPKTLASIAASNEDMIHHVMMNPSHELNLMFGSDEDKLHTSSIFRKYGEITKDIDSKDLNQEAEKNFNKGKGMINHLNYINLKRTPTEEKLNLLDDHLNKVSTKKVNKQFQNVYSSLPKDGILRKRVIQHPRASLEFLANNIDDEIKNIAGSNSHELRNYSRINKDSNQDLDVAEIARAGVTYNDNSTHSKKFFKELKNKLPEEQFHYVSLYDPDVDLESKKQSVNHLLSKSQFDPTFDVKDKMNHNAVLGWMSSKHGNDPELRKHILSHKNAGNSRDFIK